MFKRELLILETLGCAEAIRRNGLGVARIAAISGLDKGQVSRALREMALEGVVERDEVSRQYTVGWRLPAVLAHEQRTRALAAARDELERLPSRYADTIRSVGIRHGDQVHLLSSLSAVGDRPNVGWQSRRWACGEVAAGRVLLVDEAPSTWREHFRRAVNPRPDEGRADAAVPATAGDFVNRLNKVRDNGYDIVDAGTHGTASGAAPIRDGRAVVIGSLSIADVTLSGSNRTAELVVLGRTLAQAAARVSRRLGWSGGL